ncbi:hypothetical protein F1640_18505 [Novosphingobium sp. NBM11]|uniref:hypothetical protein n=1 Tax=Novosphingobium sp. NBM11 TaxID=2596914 RepID=UPI0018926558|nr:hypothetical protein [Novosphingobium sp. NBM11]MBF5091948.1 hypothetical protein [Novosphingobium sp. NBM11]
MKGTWPGAMARRIGQSGEIAFTPTRVGLTLHIPCARGNHTIDVPVEPGMHPDNVAKRMLRKGWTFGSKLACPDCSRREKRTRKEPTVMPIETTAAAQVPAESAAKVQSDAAKKAHRLVMQALEDAYDENLKAYRKGWSDDRIAKETGASAKHVADIRESYFGPIGIPSEVIALFDDLAAIRQEAGQSVSALTLQIDAVSNRLTALCRANGWRPPV